MRRYRQIASCVASDTSPHSVDVRANGATRIPRLSENSAAASLPARIGRFPCQERQKAAGVTVATARTVAAASSGKVARNSEQKVANVAWNLLSVVDALLLLIALDVSDDLPPGKSTRPTEDPHAASQYTESPL